MDRRTLAAAAALLAALAWTAGLVADPGLSTWAGGATPVADALALLTAVFVAGLAWWLEPAGIADGDPPTIRRRSGWPGPASSPSCGWPATPTRRSDAARRPPAAPAFPSPASQYLT